MLKPISLKLDSPKKTTKWHHRISLSLKILFGFVATLWAIELIDLVPGLNLDGFGVHPRSAVGLTGILLMPFLHADLSHLTSNTFPLLILGGIVVTAEKKKSILATAAIILLGGLGTWIFGGSNTNYIGASGLAYGYFGYVMIRAIIEKKTIWIATGIGVAILYGSLIWSIFPSNHDVSWMGHLCGLLSGAWFGWSRSKQIQNLEENPIDDVKKIIKDIRNALVKDEEIDEMIKDVTKKDHKEDKTVVQERVKKIQKKIQLSIETIIENYEDDDETIIEDIRNALIKDKDSEVPERDREKIKNIRKEIKDSIQANLENYKNSFL